MSLEIYVFLNKEALSPMTTWDTSIRSRGFDVVLAPGFDPLNHSGFVPCSFSGSDGGFEYYLGSRDDVASVYPDLKALVEGYDSVVSFIWDGDLAECATAIVAAAALTSVNSGLMYDHRRMSAGEEPKHWTTLVVL
jgi:hypothetical protein